eukprot:907676-Pelagomonas_calceolata.AAC.3
MANFECTSSSSSPDLKCPMHGASCCFHLSELHAPGESLDATCSSMCLSSSSGSHVLAQPHRSKETCEEEWMPLAEWMCPKPKIQSEAPSHPTEVQKR